MIYSGIGSRETPADIIAIFEHLGNWLATKGHTLRSGHAGGADLAFERGFINSGAPNNLAEIYIPWPGFNDSQSPLHNISTAAYTMAREYHPRFDSLSQGAQKLHARNCYQVLGYDLNTPTDFIICWTPNGSSSGGTGQAIRIAKQHSIPVFDFGSYKNIITAKAMFNEFLTAQQKKKEKIIKFK